MNDELDFSKLKYVLYARKSTDDEGRQIRSIPDQIRDCESLAIQLGIKIQKPYITETKSAKIPAQRPKFDQMMKDIKSGKIDGILCWHPDRLARNMIEAGEIIHLLDIGKIKDLRFHSHQFSNDANGKMLLGMLFVFSKHYSDDLSAKVKRGVDGNFSEGKSSGAPKHGYNRDENGTYVVDEAMHPLIVEAWKMRAKNKTFKDIQDYLNEKGYHKLTSNNREILMSNSAMTRMFKDPFYFGLLVQSKQTVDLREVYINFKTVTNEETYSLIQQNSYKTRRTKYKTKVKNYYPLRQFIVCAYCSRNMYVGISKPANNKYRHKLYYRCDNKSCTRSELGISKSVRAKIVFNWLYEFLDTNFNLGSDAYERYSKMIDSQSDTKIIEIKTNLRSKQSILNRLSTQIDEASNVMNNFDKGARPYEIQYKKIEKLTSEFEEVSSDIEKLKQKISKPNHLRVSKEQFLNLVKSASDKMKAGDAYEKDRITRKIFLNLKVGDQKVVSYLCNEPFATMLELTKFSSGRGERT